MRALLRLFIVVTAAALTSGCITALTNIKLRPDGSGTIEQTLSMNAEAAKQFAEMAKGFAEAAAEGNKSSGGELPEFFSEKEMQEAAAKFGEGVTFVSSKPIKTADRVGRVATYQFADITKLRIDQKPQTGDLPGAPGGEGKDEVLFRFDKTPAGTSQLTVVFPEAKFDEARKEAAEQKQQAVDPAQLAMLKTMFDGLKVAIDLDVLGTIVKTNSPYVNGSTVTLLEMDFAELLTNEKLLSEFGQPSSLEEAKAMLKDVKGFKISLDREVTVEFK